MNFQIFLRLDIQIVNEPTQVSGSLIDHNYIKKTLMKEFPTNVTVANIYFWDHDVVRIVIEENIIDFHAIP